jgi:hypothetical protein
MDPFFRTIGRYADYPSIPDLPNIDFIWNHDDVTPHDFQTRDFWITSDFEDQAPIFTYAVKKDCPYLVSVPDRFTMYNWPSLSLSILQDNLSFPWKKMQKKAFWRGQSNDYARLGIGLVDYATMFAKYSVMARYQICLLSSLYPKDIDAGFNGPGFCHNEILEQIIKPLNKDGTSSAEHMRFAYLPVIDGYTATYPGYLWRLLSNSVAFKQESEDSQWFYDALEPYVHYVPIKNRMEDLIEKINWARTNDRKCHKIAQKATKFILENLMMEDVYLYCFRVFQTYEQCLDFNTQDLLEITESDSSWVRIR